MKSSFVNAAQRKLPPVGRVSRRALLALSLLLQLLTPFVSIAPAYAATISKASFSGALDAANSASVNGTLYAKQGAAVKLTVTTSSDTRCVKVTGAHQDEAKLGGGKSSWEFNFIAGSGDGSQSVSIGAWSNASCSGTADATSTASYILDNTPPTLTGAATTQPNANDWYKADVSVAWTCSDGGAGLAAACPGISTVNGEGSNLSATQTISDKVGNSKTTTVSPIKIDRNAPVTTPSGVSNDWTNNNSVTVTLSADDGLSGVDKTLYILDNLDNGADQTYTSSGISIASEGVHSLKLWSVDKAGNTESPTTIQIKIDRTAPSIGHTLNPEPNANGWNNQASVQVTFTCQDQAELSGIKSCGPTPQTVTTEGEDQQVMGTAEDNAGNTASNTALVSIDRTKPTITGAPDRPANGNGWYKSDVTVSFTCEDALSGIDTCTGPSVLGGGSGQSVDGTATDNAGNSESTTVSGINIDKTNPTISGTKSPAVNGDGWNNTDVTVNWICGDSGESGLDGACPADETVSTEGGGQSVSRTIQDLAGNSATGIVSNINIDKTKPLVAITAPADNSSAATSPVTVSGTASDGLSGVKSVTVNSQAATYDATNGTFSLSGVALSACGTSTPIAAEVTDLAGNKSTTSIAVTLTCAPTAPTYTASFLAPFDGSTSQATIKNLAKFGRVIPVKVQITEGGAAYDGSKPAPTIKVSQLACTNSGASETVPDATSPANSGTSFRWSTDAPGFWIYNLDTRAMGLQADKCYRVDVLIGQNQATTSTWGFLQVTK